MGSDNNSPPTVINTIIWGNTAPLGPEVNPTSLDFTNCNVKDVYQGTDNLSGLALDDPQFVDPGSGDFHLQWTSPCINRGTIAGAPLDDYEGNARPFMGTVDIGAYEFVGTHPLEADGFSLSEATGGSINYTLTAGPENAYRWYIIFATLSGTNPGTLITPQVMLRINWDSFTGLMLNLLPLPAGFGGQLDSSGNATAMLPFPPGSGFTGVIHFAYLLLGPLEFPSNPVELHIY